MRIATDAKLTLPAKYGTTGANAAPRPEASRADSDGIGQPPAPDRRTLIAEWLTRAVYLGLVLLVVEAPFAPHFVQFISRLTFGLWVTRLAVGRFHPRREPLFLPFLVFFAIAGLSALLSYDPLLSWTRLGWFGMGVMILVVPDSMKSHRHLNFLIVVLLVSSCISGLRTLWQYTSGIGTKLVYVRRDCPLAGDGLWSGDIIQEINGHRTRTPTQWKREIQLTARDKRLKLHVARTYPLEHFDVIIARSDLDNWLADPTASLARGTPLRAQGGFYNSIPYAGMLMVFAALAGGLLLRAPKPSTRLILGALTFILSVSLWWTMTRAYTVALLLAFLLMLYQLIERRMRYLSLLAVALVIIMTLAWTRNARHLTSWYGEEESSRVMMWKDSPRVFIRHPLLGIGWDSIFSHGLQWNLEAYKTYPNKLFHFHSTPIQIAVDSGILGLAAWVWLMAAWFRLLLRNMKLARRSDWISNGLALALFGSAAGFVIASIVHYTLGDGEVMGTLWFLMGCAVAMHRQLREQLQS